MFSATAPQRSISFKDTNFVSYQKTRDILKARGLAPHKKLGQNFLVHPHTAERIADLADIQPEDTIIEVGVGLGALTLPLATRARRVIGIETDAGLIRWHREEGDLPDNVVLRHEDILKTDLTELARDAGRLRFVANLPYSISTPFLFRLIRHHELVDWAVIMVQKEVALRLMAEPGTKEYGAPTVLLAACATVEPLLQVKPGEFHPRPRVDSMVIRLRFTPAAPMVNTPGVSLESLRRVVNAAFGQRRKTLVNALSAGGLGMDKETLAERIRDAGLAPSIRAEKLRLEDFISLTGALFPAPVPAAEFHGSDYKKK
ncbi:ribosomal RNA small subunit methyltransferase A [Desulfolithobacter dissulfuricans]|uniref:Ribosomal RNA small subunit methyltransferase A n=1 Tax=Desulfolithobacter dissulfuricans TaxID=2795293 RepID=A0A915XI26_9BACT|nr:ribosomal RNA small subunit methyltransferase A [Desulfolithobacter dissulfuricans]